MHLEIGHGTTALGHHRFVTVDIEKGYGQLLPFFFIGKFLKQTLLDFTKDSSACTSQADEDVVFAAIVWIHGDFCFIVSRFGSFGHA